MGWQSRNMTTIEITCKVSPSLDATTTLYIDTGLEPGTQYWYQILTDAVPTTSYPLKQRLLGQSRLQPLSQPFRADQS